MEDGVAGNQEHMPPGLAGPGSVFFNRYNELRSGWRILLFVILLTAVVFAGGIPIRLLGTVLEETRLSSLAPYFGGLVFLLGAVFATWALTRFVNKKPIAAIGLWFHSRVFPELGWGLLIGFLGMSFCFLAMLLTGSLEFTPRDFDMLDAVLIVGSSILIFLIGAVSEELVFRGYPFQTLIQGITLLPAIILMAVFFAVAHLFNPHASVFGIINIALAAVFLSLAYVRTKGLWLPIGIHISWNFSQTTLFSFPTSGIAFENQKVFLTTVSGEEWITGGAFGPEGGALATVAIVGCTWFVLKSSRFVPQEGTITLDSVEDLLGDREKQEEAAAE